MKLTAAGLATALAAGLAASSFANAAPMSVGNRRMSLEQHKSQWYADTIGVPLRRTSSRDANASLRFDRYNTHNTSNLSSRDGFDLARENFEALKQGESGNFKSLLKSFKKRTPLPPAEQAHSMKDLHSKGKKSPQWADFEFKLNTIAAERRRAAWMAMLRKLTFL